MNLENIEKNLKALSKNFDKKTFIYDFLTAYELPKSSIDRLKKGDYNKSKSSGELIWNKKIYFKSLVDNNDVHYAIDELSNHDLIKKHNIRFIIVTDFKTFLAKDLKNKDTLDIDFEKIHFNSNFFLPLLGIEKAENISENLADVKAAYKMGKLYDLLLKDNPNISKNEKSRHELNLFFSKILFCFFAEDSEIFKSRLFTNSIISITKEDGEDLKIFLGRLFKVLNDPKRLNLPKYFNEFPYVNGSLFGEDIQIPNFSKESRKLLIQIGDLDWSSINPDILGSMMQAVVSQDKRNEFGIHYTSVENILKIIKPLFLDELYTDLIQASLNKKKLNSILKKIYEMRIFDPACGSGNFLVISFKELCKIELEIFKKLQSIDRNQWLIMKSGVDLNQFYGIEIDNFAHESAKLSLWIAQHQINLYFKEVLGETKPTLPLLTTGNIICANSNEINWESVCPKDPKKTTYLIGNPPYLGSTWQTKTQRLEMEKIFKNKSNFKNLDYISCWFLNGANYVKNSNSKLAFVSTNSVSQGEQVCSLWPHILNLQIEIEFAYKSFHWKNNAKAKAGVTCVIICLRNKDSRQKKFYESNTFKYVKNINPYLIELSNNTIINRTPEPLFKKPKVVYGNKPTDNGNFILSFEEKEKIINKFPEAEKYIKKYIGAQEFIKGIQRWCIWIENKELNHVKKISSINERIEKVKDFRLRSKSKSTQKAAERCHRFIGIQHDPGKALIIPCVSSGERNYIPIGFVDDSFVINNNAHAIYDPDLYIFSFISSKMHMSWVNVVSGRMRSDFNYSSSFCYNPFPIPSIDSKTKKILEEKSLEILDLREKYSDLTISELYNNKTMPHDLKNSHQDLDKFIDRTYRKEVFKSDIERVEFLFKMYENEISTKTLL